MKRASIVFVLAAALAGSALAQLAAPNPADVQTMQRYKEVRPKVVKARELVAKREFEKAKKEIAAVIDKVPDHHEAHFLMAKVLYGEKSYTEALASIEKAEKSFVSVTRLMVEMQDDRRSELLKRRNELQITINNLRVQMPARTTEANLNQAAARQAQIERAEQLLRDIDRELTSNPVGASEAKAPPEYAFFHGNILLRLQKYPEAVAQYEEALAADPQYADAANNLASLY
ncbi:MAG TPA: tetratricopeptide repeat protein, partial [Thermoanaerobaculia bacterium]|nr:tetratricopeptide repeat protein [Thermoanaerobaculia bacterium]